jgi:uncharacterized protein YjeT (DUF2065 family)
VAKFATGDNFEECIYILTTVEEPKTRLTGIAAISVGVCADGIVAKALHAATLAFICGRGVAHRVTARHMNSGWREAHGATEAERQTRLAGIARISVGVCVCGIRRAKALRAATAAFIYGWGDAGRGTGDERSTRLAGIARISVSVAKLGIANALRAATRAFSCLWLGAEMGGTANERRTRLAGSARISLGV